MSPDPITAGAVATAALEKTFEEVSKAVAPSLLKFAHKQVRQILADSLTTFTDHFSATWERCTKIKTILNRHEPVSLLSQYTQVHFLLGKSRIEDLDVIDRIRETKKVIISGSGGGGKTIFMKYLWVCLFENPRGKIPIFVELRKLNDLTTVDLMLYVYNLCVADESVFSKKSFDQAVSAGSFAFILDGFDEVGHARREIIEKQILKLSESNSDNIIVVSGRSDDRFDSWEHFTNFKVAPLSLDQCLSLVGKINYDAVTKTRFIEKLKKNLYRRHESFASNPLLLIMMLMTFSEYAEIPEKVHVFYSQAFDTLYHKHDATKESFKREMHAKLSEDVFKKIFSYFCLITYFEEKFEFEEWEVLEYIKKSISIEKSDVDNKLFFKDLIESTCMLQRDGIKISFSHRSFQEYFAARCLAFVSQRNIEHFLSRFCRRSTDNVIVMLYDMCSSVVDERFLIPYLEKIVRGVEGKTGFELIVAFSQIFGHSIEVLARQPSSTKRDGRRGGGRSRERVSTTGARLYESNTSGGDMHGFRDVLRRLFADDFSALTSQERWENWHAEDARAIRKCLVPVLSHEGDDAALDKPLLILDEHGKVSRFDEALTREFLVATGYIKFLDGSAKFMRKKLRDIAASNKNRDKRLDEIFSFNIS